MGIFKRCPSVAVVDALRTVHLAEWWSSLFAVGFGLVLLLSGHNRLSIGLLQGPVVQRFSSYSAAYSIMVAVAGLIGVYGLARKQRRVRMLASLIQFATLGWLPLYYYWAVPIPWQGVWVYTMHALLEGAIYVRVNHGLDKNWLQ